MARRVQGSRRSTTACSLGRRNQRVKTGRPAMSRAASTASRVPIAVTFVHTSTSDPDIWFVAALITFTVASLHAEPLVASQPAPPAASCPPRSRSEAPRRCGSPGSPRTRRSARLGRSLGGVGWLPLAGEDHSLDSPCTILTATYIPSQPKRTVTSVAQLMGSVNHGKTSAVPRSAPRAKSPMPTAG